ncbi:MAG: glycyl-radical enzyme activating protein [Planctomycetota bacterium]
MGGGRPLIVDVKRHALADGPGIRSVVFFKGCPLRCVFCQNPETQDPKPEISFVAARCIGCRACASTCPRGAVDPDLPGRVRREECVRCGSCAEACSANALRLIGTYRPPGELAAELLRDRAYYRHSGGGVTLSGGECTMYPAYLERLLRKLKQEGVHVALETCGSFDYEVFERKLLPHLDLVYYDIKIVDGDDHRRHTGKGNEAVLGNFRRLVSSGAVEVHPRVPLVPGVTATRENLAAVADFLCGAGADGVSLVPYNPMGADMYECLGRASPPLPASFMKREEEEAIHSMFRAVLRGKERDVAVASG